jgi:uncharacterized protein (TIGR00251 family)
LVNVGITSVAGGVVFDVRVIPRAAKAGIAGMREGAVLVRLNAPPVDGAANGELIEVVADALRVPRRSVTLVSGARSRQKRVQVLGVSAAAVAALLGG